MVEHLRMTTPRGAREGHRAGRLQHLPARERRRLHRPAHRLGHLGHERRAVGRHDARRRSLRGQPQLLPPRGSRARDLRLSPPGAHPPGPRRRAHPLPGPDPAGRRDPRQHVLHDDAPASGARRRQLRRRDHRRSPRPGQRAPLQGQRRPREAAAGHRRGRRRADPLRLRGHGGQHGRRPADQPRQPARRPGPLRQARHPHHPRRHARRRERLLPQGQRGRVRRHDASPRSSAPCAISPTAAR